MDIEACKLYRDQQPDSNHTYVLHRAKSYEMVPSSSMM
jgi:hypothetical protein